MTNETEAVAERMKWLRRRRGWTAADLAERLAEIGVPELNKSVIANIESHRRKYVTIDEVFALAWALDVAPVHLLVPVEEEHEDVGVRGMSLNQARAWVRGTYCPPGIDSRTFFSEVPADEFSASRIPA